MRDSPEQLNINPLSISNVYREYKIHATSASDVYSNILKKGGCSGAVLIKIDILMFLGSLEFINSTQFKIADPNGRINI